MTPKFAFHREILLQNEFSLLRPLEITDFDGFWDISKKNENLLQFSPAPINTEERLREYIRVALTQRKQKERYAFTIIDKHNGKIAGSSSFMNISEANARLEIGSTWLDPELHGKGLNKQNKLLMLNYAFEQLGFERVELKTDSRNIQSQKAILKIGAQFEGRLRSHTLMSDGFRRDTVYFSILRSEWPAIKVLLSKN